MRWQIGWRWAVCCVSPLALFAVAAAAATASGGWPGADAMERFSGLPALGVLPILSLLVLAAVREEAGWRGFALPHLLRHHDPLVASLMLAARWGVWHLPQFFIIDTYGGFSLPTLVGFFFGLACGSVILTWLYNGTRGSILAVAIWHGCYAFASGTSAASGTIAAVVTTVIVFWAVAIVRAQVCSTHRGKPPGKPQASPVPE